MTKNIKELAFLQDLYLWNDWTERFTTTINENFKFKKVKKLLYLNAGTGNHTLEIREKMDSKAELFGFCENKFLQKIAEAKANIIQTNVKFSTDLPVDKFDEIIADASLVNSQNLTEFIKQITQLAAGEVVFFLPTAGSFGEIFSFLWETFFNLELTEKGAEIERLIAELPTVSDVEELAQTIGLNDVTSITKTEIFEFANGKEFIESPLIANFLLPKWLDFLSDKESKQVAKNLVKVIDGDDRDLSFRFSVKATFVTGKMK